MKRERGNKSDTRDVLDRYILENPGVSFIHIMKVFGINRGTLRYHMDYLLGRKGFEVSGKGSRTATSPTRGEL